MGFMGKSTISMAIFNNQRVIQTILAEEHEEEIRQARERQKFYRNPRDAELRKTKNRWLWPSAVVALNSSFFGFIMIYNHYIPW